MTRTRRSLMRHKKCCAKCETASRGRWPVFWKFYVVLLEQLGFALSQSLIANAMTPTRREAKAVLTKLLDGEFSVAARLRVSPQAEREIHGFLIDYLSGHLHGPAQPRTMDSLRWIRRPLRNTNTLSASNIMDKVVSLCKRRGFVFQSSKIYGGLASIWDYGPMGIALKNNIANYWWRE